MRNSLLGSHTFSIDYFTFFDNLALILFAFPFFKTPFLAALSTAEKAKLRDSRDKRDLKLSMAVFAFVFVARLTAAFFLSDLSFLIADFVIGMAPFYHELLLAQVTLLN